jgi:hypothetical protein
MLTGIEIGYSRQSVIMRVCMGFESGEQFGERVQFETLLVFPHIIRQSLDRLKDIYLPDCHCLFTDFSLQMNYYSYKKKKRKKRPDRIHFTQKAKSIAFVRACSALGAILLCS